MIISVNCTLAVLELPRLRHQHFEWDKRITLMRIYLGQSNKKICIHCQVNAFSSIQNNMHNM